MAKVVLQATLPSVRFGLSAMLAEHGHHVVGADQADESAVWLLDAPSASALDGLLHGRSDPPPCAVVLADDPEVAHALTAARLRGWACLSRDAGAAELDLAVRAAEAGLVLMDLPATAQVARPRAGALAATTPSGALESLTPRELQVLQLVAEGQPNKGIARTLGITENTAKFHVASLCAKLGAASRTEAVALAARRGLVVL